MVPGKSLVGTLLLENHFALLCNANGLLCILPLDPTNKIFGLSFLRNFRRITTVHVCLQFILYARHGGWGLWFSWVARQLVIYFENTCCQTFIITKMLFIDKGVHSFCQEEGCKLFDYRFFFWKRWRSCTFQVTILCPHRVTYFELF